MRGKGLYRKYGLKYDFGGPGVVPVGDRKLGKGCEQGVPHSLW